MTYCRGNTCLHIDAIRLAYVLKYYHVNDLIIPWFVILKKRDRLSVITSLFTPRASPCDFSSTYTVARSCYSADRAIQTHKQSIIVRNLPVQSEEAFVTKFEIEAAFVCYPDVKIAEVQCKRLDTRVKSVLQTNKFISVSTTVAW